ncbi:alpha/beta hydrolase [Pseudonocardia nematodicida]|uniref:Alpha/beta hydrolase n=1 Tax=Pseudonocardia nematodicida TaxID=1206997 RepID=A0ABV1K4Y0_9PSEU
MARTEPVGLDAELDALRRAALGAAVAPMVELPPAAVRERVSAGDRLCAAGPPVEVRDTTADGVPVRIYEGARSRATLAWAHGGGWVTGDLEYSDEICRFLAAHADVRVVSVDYRLAPEHPLPAGADDVARGLAWCRRMWPGTAICTGGDSAGGHLAVAAAARGGADALVLVYPVLDRPGRWPSYDSMGDAFPIGRAAMDWFWRHAGGDLLPPGEMPLERADLGALPPVLLVLAGHDPLHDEGIAFADRVRTGGGTVTVTDHPALCHGFLRFSAASATVAAARTDLVESVRRLVLDL